jgi:exopolysaccharide production protein ExoY
VRETRATRRRGAPGEPEQILPVGLSIAESPLDGVDLVVVPELPPAGARKDLVRRAAKRALDIVASLGLIVLVLPFTLFIGLIIVLDSAGPVLFAQRRVGRHGQGFPLLKFRTMVADGDAGFASYIASKPELLQEWERSRKLRIDPRVTRVGRFLRRHSVDELPQILNVLRGHMSLVGPRPVRHDEVECFGERADEILSVRPGLTGLWAVSGRSDLTYKERAELEARYVRDWSLRSDLRILLRTLPVVVRGHGAY